MTKTQKPRKNYTVEIGGVVIASFLMADDAMFFADKANEAGMFSLTNPGEKAMPYDSRGHLLEPDSYKSA